MTSSSLARRARQLVLERDKQQHFVVCLLLTVMLLATPAGPVITLAIVTAVGLGKELWDKHYGSGFCWYDMLANGVGAVAGMLLLLPLNI